MPLKVNDDIIIYEEDISFEFSRSSGPGGQNVNKVESAVTLRFNISGSSLPDNIKSRLLNSGDKRINSDGELLINARESRSQLQNKQLALNKLIEILRTAAIPEKKRFATRPSKAAREKRIEIKKRRSETKKLRGRVV
ncbi:MAG: alternative ribosome rescue aminoacyl-tRNA hydrolase ArfB [Candidatus Kapabacteria bacterium]|nr:alternative ribosome rescue aminoacyl-tRNA hydrolase ArfB [Candidatus Kapabacteria bacterium]